MKIDIYDLEHEAAGQAETHRTYTQELATLNNTKSDIKDELKALTSRVELQYRNDDRDLQFVNASFITDGKVNIKITEKSVLALVECDFEVIAKKKEYNRSIYNAENQQGMVDSSAQRKNMIEKEITLWINNYYADPKHPRIYGDDVDEQIRKLKDSKRNNKD